MLLLRAYVATDSQPENSINRYAIRWEIETLLGCLKGRGFNFEDTHITNTERIKKLLVLLAVAFVWAHKTGECRSESKPIKIKKHGRRIVSLFRMGLDYVSFAIVNAFKRPDVIQSCMRAFSISDSWGKEKVLV